LEYRYQIDYLDSYPTYSSLDNVVCNVVYQLHGSSGSLMTTIHAQQEIPINSSNPNFIPFEELTKEEVINWIETTEPDKIAGMKREIETSIIALMKPESVRATPPFPN
jgi:hypothetical protein